MKKVILSYPSISAKWTVRDFSKDTYWDRKREKEKQKRKGKLRKNSLRKKERKKFSNRSLFSLFVGHEIFEWKIQFWLLVHFSLMFAILKLYFELFLIDMLRAILLHFRKQTTLIFSNILLFAPLESGIFNYIESVCHEV